MSYGLVYLVCLWACGPIRLCAPAYLLLCDSPKRWRLEETITTITSPSCRGSGRAGFRLGLARGVVVRCRGGLPLSESFSGTGKQLPHVAGKVVLPVGWWGGREGLGSPPGGLVGCPHNMAAGFSRARDAREQDSCSASSEPAWESPLPPRVGHAGPPGFGVWGAAVQGRRDARELVPAVPAPSSLCLPSVPAGRLSHAPVFCAW